MNYINASILEPPNYILPGDWWPGSGQNCTTWAKDALNVAGVPAQFGATTNWTFSPYGQAMYLALSDFFSRAQAWIAPAGRDPLTLDLNNDGINVIAINPANPILFDHDADGIKTATSWIAPQDGLLVLDRNGNGVIDSGRELFGDSTLLATGVTAFDGFAALADLDTNKDGVFNASDAQFTNVRVWKDANSDAVSQTGELLTLQQLNIQSLSLTKTAVNQVLPDGTRITDVSTFTYADGTTSTLATTGKLADVDFRENTFFSNFITPVAITPAAQALPNMSGSGLVRDLREAASLSPALTTTLTNYAAAPTRAAQLAQLDGLIDAWGDTSNLPNFVDSAIANNLRPTGQSLRWAA